MFTLNLKIPLNTKKEEKILVKSMRVKMKYITLAGLIISAISVTWYIGITQPSIDYWLEKPQPFIRGLNSITIYCKNGGESDGDFCLVVTFINASFSNQTEQPYLQVDNTTVKIRFLLHKMEQNEKKIYFYVNETVETFSIHLSLEKINWYDILKPNPRYPTELEYEWNEAVKEFHPTQ